MCGVPASLLVLRRAAPGELPQFQVAGQRLVHGLVREGDGRAVRQRIDDADRGGQLLRGVVHPELRGQRQARGHPPALARKDRGQGRLDALAGDDLVVLIDEDDLERPCRVESWSGLVLWTGCFEGCWLLLVVLCPLARVLVG